MNQLKGIVAKIASFEQLSFVTVQVGQDLFSATLINTPDTNAFRRVGKEIYMVFKQTEVAIGKNLSGGLITRNRFRAQLKTIVAGQLLTQLSLSFKGDTIHSIITSRSARELDLQVGDWVEGLVKTNEVTLLQP